MLMGLEDNLMNTLDAQSCAQVGKDCRGCVRQSAEVVALLCPALDAAGAQQMFFRMYRQPGCGGMARSFVREYLSIAEEEAGFLPGSEQFYEVAACA
jgi:hypothetical protein